VSAAGPVVDAHQHFWDPARADYPWMTGEAAALRRPFGPDDLAPLIRAAGVDWTVVVQARMDVAETRELLEIAAGTDFVAGVVGWVDLAGPEVGEELRRLRAEPGGDRLAGIRHQVHDEADPRWLLRPEVQRGLAAVAEAGLAYDLLVRTRELPAALETARRHPDVRFVIDHLAKPPIASGWSGEWAAAMAPFADLGHVACKLSGLVTEAGPGRATAADLEPYVTRALDWFGAGRCLFGSDWPVCTLVAPYQAVVDALGECLRGLGEADRAAVMGGNATRLYRLPS
jgi:L-fucono-1,5-lactonase